MRNLFWLGNTQYCGPDRHYRAILVYFDQAFNLKSGNAFHLPLVGRCMRLLNFHARFGAAVGAEQPYLLVARAGG